MRRLQTDERALRFHKSCALVSLVMPSSPRRSVLTMEIRLAPLTRFSNTAESVCHTRERTRNMRACMHMHYAYNVQSMMSTGKETTSQIRADQGRVNEQIFRCTGPDCSGGVQESGKAGESGSTKATNYES